MTIPRIHVKEVKIPNIYTPDWMNHQPNVDHLVPPVVLNIGNPIVDIPGCVKMHRDISIITTDYQLIKILLRMILTEQ